MSGLHYHCLQVYIFHNVVIYMPTPGFLYILKCANDSYYTGSTTDLPRRLVEHQTGEGAEYTKRHLPVTLVFSQEFYDVSDAFFCECRIKKWKRSKKEALISGNYDLLKELSVCMNNSHYSNLDKKVND